MSPYTVNVPTVELWKLGSTKLLDTETSQLSERAHSIQLDQVVRSVTSRRYYRAHNEPYERKAIMQTYLQVTGILFHVIVGGVLTLSAFFYWCTRSVRKEKSQRIRNEAAIAIMKDNSRPVVTENNGQVSVIDIP